MSSGLNVGEGAAPKQASYVRFRWYTEHVNPHVQMTCSDVSQNGVALSRRLTNSETVASQLTIQATSNRSYSNQGASYTPTMNKADTHIITTEVNPGEALTLGELSQDKVDVNSQNTFRDHLRYALYEYTPVYPENEDDVPELLKVYTHQELGRMLDAIDLAEEQAKYLEEQRAFEARRRQLVANMMRIDPKHVDNELAERYLHAKVLHYTADVPRSTCNACPAIHCSCSKASVSDTGRQRRCYFPGH